MKYIINGLLTGLVATAVLSLLMMMKGVMGLMPDPDVISMLASQMGSSQAIGWLDHIMIGVIVCGLAYTLIFLKLPLGGHLGQGLGLGTLSPKCRRRDYMMYPPTICLYATKISLPGWLGYNAPYLSGHVSTMSDPLQGIAKQATTDSFSEADITALRHDMLRFARLQLRDEATAEDAVQEALTAAYTARDRFAGRSQLKTWVFSILRNKIIDILRERTRHPTQSLTANDGSDVELDKLFDEKGKWRKQERPADWGHPETELDNEEFWRIFEICLNDLPEQNARVFTMREFLGFETTEICVELGISESNCWVILHRARSRLRLCLEKEWFA